VGAEDVGADNGRAGGLDCVLDLKAMAHSATSDTEEHSRLPVGVVHASWWRQPGASFGA
jgi:hypothetical protein